MKAAATHAKKRRKTESSRRRQEPWPGSGGERDQGGVNLFSLLPDDLLCDIISFLPTKDGARTRILASRWRHLWLSAPLNLDQGTLLLRDNALVAVLFSRILAAHGGPVRRLSVHTLALHYSPTVDNWLRSPAFAKLQELEFDDGGVDYIYRSPLGLLSLPASALRLSATLRVVTISKCKFPDGGETLRLRFPQLEMLGLERVMISEASLHGFITGSPVLDSLLLKHNSGFDSLRINSPRLTRFGLETSSVYRLVIEDAPLLQRLVLPGRRAVGLRVSVISAPKLETLGPIYSFLILPALPQEYGAFSFTAVMPSVMIVAINIYCLSLDWVINLMMGFPSLKKLYIKSSVSNETNLWRRKHRHLIRSLDIRLKTIVLTNYRGIMSQVNFATFFVLNAKLLEVMRFEGGANNDDEMFIAKQRRLLQIEKRVSRDARFHFTTGECEHHTIDVKNVRNLSIADPFECQY